MTLQLREVSFRIDSKLLLSNINISIQPAKIVSFIGPNGAGKTTLLRVASGALSAPGVTLDSKPLKALTPEGRARKFAFLNQSSELNFPFKCLEVLHLGRIPHRTSRRCNERIVEEVINSLSLDKLVDRIYTTMSGGEKQRVQIGRILCQVWDNIDSAFVFFDEPTAELDLAHQLRFFDTVKMLAARGASISLVLHDINLASRFSDELILLKSGKILAIGSPREVVTRANIRDAFSVQAEVHHLSCRPIVQANSVIKD
ncbi:MAG: ATP-binding cassette domain-containing protein [Pseudomonadota bacterium]|nr:ATP-binding cassette domain-containing protein [Pseudomonadota bacterium]